MRILGKDNGRHVVENADGSQVLMNDEELAEAMKEPKPVTQKAVRSAPVTKDVKNADETKSEDDLA